MEEGLVGITLENPKPGELFTVSILLESDELERVVIKDYEFHCYLAGMRERTSDFPRPDILSYEGEKDEMEYEDGDTLGKEPFELEKVKLAGMPRKMSGQLA
jgi:hypothetical protein